ncbi:MAG TPA: 2-amino-4-hydroxy-6-hydroxymethyldihydropteridine diphosphokinase [Pirellulaceae bacterium]|nr:2-amino-4-hydroxy-6-hydroxymethyldihydropteridine diphosphokinase [Pirellulaceae bacterium]
MADCLIALGANLGDPAATLQAVLAELAQHPRIARLTHSRWHRTQAIGGPAGQAVFLNAAARFETDLQPPALLALLQRLEQAHGRERLLHWGPRTLDLDLLLYDQAVQHAEQLELPHPRLAWRRFVLEPAVEIAAEMIHPTTGLSLHQLLHNVNDAPHYLALGSCCWIAKQYLVAQAIPRLATQGISARTTATRGMTVFAPAPVSDPEHSFAEHFIELMPRLAADLRSALRGPRAPWLISSFWPGELALGAQLWFTGAARDAAEQAYASEFADLPTPKLIVYLETPDDLLLLDPQSPGQVATYYEQAARMIAQRDALNAAVEAQRSLPVMRLSAARPEQAIDEVVAAVLAMQPLDTK